MTQTTNYNLNKFETTDKLNPTTLNGLNSNADILDSALVGKAPANHASTEQTYGVATNVNYGHCKIRNTLTVDTHVAGEALSAYQGYVLNQNKQDKLTIATSITSSSTNNEVAGAKAVYDLTNKSIITASKVLTMILSSSNTYILVPLTFFNGEGSKFTINSNGEIVIGDNVSKILIGGKCVFTSHTSGIKYFAIYQNNTKVYTAYKTIANGQANELICPSYVMNVNTGDKIGLYVYGNANDDINGGDNINEIITYLTLEEIS